jgi:hypothetical protein
MPPACLFLVSAVEAHAYPKYRAFIMMGRGWPKSIPRRLFLPSKIKKLLVSAQNLENKGVEIFLPPRSMVLKVVRGKILETLELRGLLDALGSVSGKFGQGWPAGYPPVEMLPRQVVKDRILSCR